ncbi:MAG: hypothetical protein M3R54_06395 [Chloroflexota bacterium]|nr:hypothetical protein [Chloroflexota bacterium]
MPIDERDLRIALEHPRGTERRALLPYREALNDTAAYSRLPPDDRDAIVRWTEIRRRLKHDHGLDHDPANLADPLLPYEALRAVVLAGEAGGADIAIDTDADADVRELVRAIRAWAGAGRG